MTRRLAFRPDAAERLALVERYEPSAAHRSGATVSRAGHEVRLEQRTPISDQGELGSCVANATMDAMELLMPADRVVQLSRLFCYWTARRADGDGAECRDDGTYIRQALAQAADLGVCREELYPYDVADVHRRPTLMAYEEALDHRIDAYYRIAGAGSARVARIKAAIDFGLPVVFGAAVGQEWMDLADWHAVGAPTRSLGGHAMVIVGYDEEAAIVRNSWGTAWGVDGLGRMAWPYVASALDVDEVFTLTMAPRM